MAAIKFKFESTLSHFVKLVVLNTLWYFVDEVTLELNVIFVVIKHYLTEDGINFFPEWFKTALSVIRTKDGFYNAKYAFDKNDSSCVVIFLEFENEEKLTRWGHSDEHHHMVSLLDPYRTKPYEVSKFIIEASSEDYLQ